MRRAQRASVSYHCHCWARGRWPRRELYRECGITFTVTTTMNSRNDIWFVKSCYLSLLLIICVIFTASRSRVCRTGDEIDLNRSPVEGGAWYHQPPLLPVRDGRLPSVVPIVPPTHPWGRAASNCRLGGPCSWRSKVSKGRSTAHCVHCGGIKHKLLYFPVSTKDAGTTIRDHFHHILIISA